MKRFTRNRHFMPGSPLWRQEQERRAAEAAAQDDANLESLGLVEKAKKVLTSKAKKKSTKAKK